MPLRVIELITPRQDKDEVVKSLEEHRPDEGYVYWASPLDDDTALCFRIVLDVEESEDVMDKLENLFAWSEKYRMVVYEAQATLPRLSEPPEDKPEEAAPENGKRRNRLSREELYTDALDTSLLTRNFVLLTLFSALIAVIGLVRDSVAVIIGAMVLAPLLGPNVGLSLATTLGDRELALAASKTLAAGVALILALASAYALVFGLPAHSAELASRSATSYADIVLAIVSGAAGIISFTSGAPTSLVGVMVALSLLPPLTACGLFLGAADLPRAAGAGLLFLTNVICLNLAGVTTFLLQGIQPLTWWEQKRARTAALRSVAIWAGLLLLLLAALYLSHR
ncbi:TIGR00341 family protein [Pseudodesulfovibrio sp.]|uniref:TIGR00341 family protein n=1 Tax=Pseudodesulfovibrio sp. TaxID=2035812 RepID=UPI002635DF1A|nr:TIGR00341 family protein [Pseudodesulfovibrio sp.]MDD3312714.1 TIGR00341 family protein [Pseudodesulfovibrio sp.]